MKILISVGTLASGGAERVVANLSKILANLGHEVEILLYYDSIIFYTIDDTVKITIDEVEMSGKKNVLSHLMWRRCYIKNVNPDVVISFLAPFNMLNIVALLGLTPPLIVADRNDPRCVPTAPIMRIARNFLYHFATRVVLQSNNNKSYFSKRIQEKSDVIYNPISMGTYCGAGLKARKRNRIVSVGRIISQKNPMMLINAFEKIAKEFPTYTLSFYGEGELREELEQYVSTSSVANRVYFHGAVDNIFDKILDADLFIMTSHYEGLPNALLEAMCLGLPVISTKVSGATDFIRHGINGELIDCNDVDGLADTMRRLLTDSSLRESYGQTATSITADLDEVSIANSWLECIEKCKYIRKKK